MILNEESLKPVRLESSPQPTKWRQFLIRPEPDFQIEAIPDLRRPGGPMQVELISDSDGSDQDGATWILRWEHGGSNRDRAVPKPWPEPTMLRLYKISNTERVTH